MSFGTTRKPNQRLELQMIEKTARDDARVFVVVPTPEQLLGEPAFGHRNPIFLPGRQRPLDGWGIFGSVRERGIVLH